MKKIPSAILLALFFQIACLANGQTNLPPSTEELKSITARGRALAEYDAAAWHATDTVMSLHPEESSVRRYLARKTSSGWTVVFGRLSEKRDEFLIAYEATAPASAEKFRTTEYRPPKEDTDFFMRAALATDTALAAFGAQGRPYNVAAIRTTQDQWWVYVVPAPTQTGIWPLGGDMRYLISADGIKINESRVLHKTILEMAAPIDKKPEYGFHTAVLADVPEDTDVFHVLTRKTQVPEYVLTEGFLYKIETNGTIHIVMTHEELRKKKP